MGIKKRSEQNVLIQEENDQILFDFSDLQEASLLDCSEVKCLKDFLFRLQKLGKLGWNEIMISNRHSFGTEKIPRKCIKVKKLPSCITDDIKHFIAFRANGNNLPFLGIRVGAAFKVIFIETKFGDIYDHD